MRKLLVSLADQDREDAYHLLIHLYPDFAEKANSLLVMLQEPQSWENSTKRELVENPYLSRNRRWTANEWKILNDLCRVFGIGQWQQILGSKLLPGKSRAQLVTGVP